MSSDVQASVFSEVLARVESRFNHFRTVIHDPNGRVAAISAIDKEIDQQFKAVDEHLKVVNAARQLLHSQLARRNALTPISLLPPEVLARVFHFLVFEDPACSREQNLGWIRSTHVCRFWRQVALGDSSLWTTISGISTNAEFISEMLSRARNAPLDIEIVLSGASGREVLRMCHPHPFHTRKLRLFSPSTLRSDSVRAIYRREAPALEHFELGVSGTSPITIRGLDRTTLFKGQAPRLRTFSLSQVFIPWSHIPRGQLTQLKIVLFNDLPLHDAPQNDLNELIDFLINCPVLETLVLEHCLPFRLNHNNQISRGQTIHLPRLSSVCLLGPSSRITNLMKMLKLPSSTKLHLRCISENSSTHNDRFLFPVVAAQFQGLAPIEFKSLSVTIGYRNHLLYVAASTTVSSWRSQFKDFEGDMDDNAEFVLSFDGLPEPGNWTDLLERVCKMLPISDLEFLFIYTFDIRNSVNWVELFKRCMKVTTMQVIGRGTSGLVRALTTPKAPNTEPNGKGSKTRYGNRDSTPARSTAAPAEAPIFPKLSFLSLKSLDFAEDEHSSGILFDVVEKGLRQRKAASKAPLSLRMLRVDNCAISARRANALQKRVWEFLWDGEEGIFDEFEGSD
jgi:hypothetical protein